MNKKEFSNRRDKLQKEIFNTLLAYKVYLSIWPTEEVIEVFNRYKDFFQPVRIALYYKWTMGLANIFDNNSRTASITNLLNIAINNKEKLVQNNLKGNSIEVEDLMQNLSLDDLIKLQADLLEHEITLEKIKKERDQYLAHIDSNPKPLSKKLKGDIDSLFGAVKATFNKLSSGHDGNLFSWSFTEESASRNATEIFRVLKDDILRRKEANGLIQDTL
ncbi:MAG: hypothetical protein ACOWWR_03065 [Eubacteriales bacterium]